MRAISILAMIGVVLIAAGCDGTAPATSSAAPAAGTGASASTAAAPTDATVSVPEAEPAAIDAAISVVGRTLKVPTKTLEDEDQLRIAFEQGGGIIEPELHEHLLTLAKGGKATLLSAPGVGVRSGERASVVVGQTGGTAGSLNQSKQSLEFGVVATALEGGAIDFAVEAKLIQLDNGVEVALDNWGVPIGDRAKGKAKHRVIPPQTVYIARRLDGDWYVWLASPRLMEEPAAAPGP